MNDLIRQEGQTKSWLVPTNQAEARELATALSKSLLVPKAYQGKPDDCMVALIVAQEKGLSIWDTFQNLFIIEGRTGWDAKFIIQSINNSGVLANRLQFKKNKLGTVTIPKQEAIPYKAADPNAGRPYPQKAKPERPAVTLEAVEYIAWGQTPSGEVLEGPGISIKNAIAAKWVDRNPEQWIGDTDNMCMLRAARRFANMYGIGIGGPSIDEIRDSEPMQSEYTEAVVVETTTPRKPKPAPSTATAPTPTHVVTITEAVTIDDGLEAAKEEQRKLAAGDTEWTAAIDAAASLEDIDRVQQEFDL